MKMINYPYLVKKRSGKSYFSQLCDLIRLRFVNKGIGFSEYYRLELFDDNIYPWCKKKYFIGRRFSEHIDKLLNRDTWRAVAEDKVLCYSTLRNLGFPIPETVATYSKCGRHIGDERILKTSNDVSEFLESYHGYPIFAKPIHGYLGKGAYGISKVDTRTGVMELINGNRADIQKLYRDILHEPFEGMLFQKVLEPLAPIREIFGNRISCLRVIVIFAANGPSIHIVFWKFARERNMVDNFYGGKYGNLVGWVNAGNGKVQRVIEGFWPQNKDIDHHPDTQKKMVDFIIPGWNNVVDLCLSAAENFPGLRLQNWDIALSERGPVLMELNTESGMLIPQVIGRKPFLDSELLNIIDSTRYKKK